MSGCRRVTPVVQKTHLVRAGRLQRRHAVEQQFEFFGNPARRTGNHRKWIRPASAEKPCVAGSCFDHFPLSAS
jgi:hypothetical protein